MSSNNKHDFQCSSSNYNYDETWPDLNHVKKAQNQFPSKPNLKPTKKHQEKVDAYELKESVEKNDPYFTLDHNDDNKIRKNVPALSRHCNNRHNFSTITQNSPRNHSPLHTMLVSPTNSMKGTTVSSREGVFESFQNEGLGYKTENTYQTNSSYKTKALEEDTRLVYTPAQLQVNRKSEMALRRQARRLENEHREAGVSGVKAMKPDFCLEQATADFPALDCTSGCRKSKRVNKTVDKSNSCLENINGQAIITNGLQATQVVKKSWKPKKKDPININIQSALQSTVHPDKTKIVLKRNDHNVQHYIQVGNTLDSDKPQQKRGKVRPDKEKKPTKLKCQILLDRNERQKVRDKLQAQPLISADPVSNSEQNNSPLYTRYDQLSSILEQCTLLEPESSICLSDQKSIIEKSNDEEQPVIRKKWHSRRFREYCTNSLTEDLTSSVVAFLGKIALFQDRTFNQNPIKATAKRRYVAGISQTNKYLQVKKVKLLLIAPDIEKNSKEGGLDEKINYFIKTADSQGVPCVFGPNRKQLGMAVFKKVYVSCVAVLNYEGAEDLFSKVLTNLSEAREKYVLLTGLSTDAAEENLESKPEEAPPDSGLDEISTSILATLREQLSPAEKLLKAIGSNPS